MKTNLLANLANKTFAFATVMMMGLAFVACSSDDDKNADENLKPTTVTIDKVDKKVVNAAYRNWGNNGYSITLSLSDNGPERVDLFLNTEDHMGKDIDITQEQEGDAPSWEVRYYNSKNQPIIMTHAHKQESTNFFSEGNLRFEGNPNETITITLTKGKVMGKDNQEHTIQISYQASSLDDWGFVDLGLSVKWAVDNLGSYPGDRYAWGEIVPKQNYNWANYKWGNANENRLTKYSTDNNYGQADNVTTLLPEDDAATNFYKSPRYRMPTAKEFDELLKKCEWKWTTRGNVNGYEVKGPNGRSIFLRSTGYIRQNNLYTLRYWSSTLNTNECKEAYQLSCSKTSSKTSRTIASGERAHDFQIRAVRQ